MESHSICVNCYNRINDEPVHRNDYPHALKSPPVDTCCFCLVQHKSGIYVRAHQINTLCMGHNLLKTDDRSVSEKAMGRYTNSLANKNEKREDFETVEPSSILNAGSILNDYLTNRNQFKKAIYNAMTTDIKAHTLPTIEEIEDSEREPPVDF